SFLEESPRWYEHRGRSDDAQRVLRRIEHEIEREHGSLPAVHDDSVVQAPQRREGFSALVTSGSLWRTALLGAVWAFGALGFNGFTAWVPTLLTERGFSIVRALERSSAMQIGAVPGAWIAARVSDRWERKSLIALTSLLIAACGIAYGMSTHDATIVL